jgi:hypothetical protein
MSIFAKANRLTRLGNRPRSRPTYRGIVHAAIRQMHAFKQKNRSYSNLYFIKKGENKLVCFEVVEKLGPKHA